MPNLTMKARDKLLILLGQRIKQKRRELKMKQEELAGKTGLHRSYVSDVELGKRNLGFCILVSIALALNTTVSELAIGIEQFFPLRRN